jgi:hypothetical protein
MRHGDAGREASASGERRRSFQLRSQEPKLSASARLRRGDRGGAARLKAALPVSEAGSFAYLARIRTASFRPASSWTEIVSSPGRRGGSTVSFDEAQRRRSFQLRSQEPKLSASARLRRGDRGGAARLKAALPVSEAGSFAYLARILTASFRPASSWTEIVSSPGRRGGSTVSFEEAQRRRSFQLRSQEPKLSASARLRRGDRGGAARLKAALPVSEAGSFAYLARILTASSLTGAEAFSFGSASSRGSGRIRAAESRASCERSWKLRLPRSNSYGVFSSRVVLDRDRELAGTEGEVDGVVRGGAA